MTPTLISKRDMEAIRTFFASCFTSAKRFAITTRRSLTIKNGPSTTSSTKTGAAHTENPSMVLWRTSLHPCVAIIWNTVITACPASFQWRAPAKSCASSPSGRHWYICGHFCVPEDHESAQTKSPYVSSIGTTCSAEPSTSLKHRPSNDPWKIWKPTTPDTNTRNRSSENTVTSAGTHEAMSVTKMCMLPNPRTARKSRRGRSRRNTERLADASSDCKLIRSTIPVTTMKKSRQFHASFRYAFVPKMNPWATILRRHSAEKTITKT
mmetsp:Transcript_48588/g.115668  ORF Transcript_48588/g.115668 Transcript_48588/m.115668 type:complete len:266 (-) Transcript_48588:565-1362(-)